MSEKKRVRVKGILIFESLFEKTAITRDDEPKYSITVLIPKDSPEVEKLQKEIDSVANEYFKGNIPKGARTYLMDGDVDKEQEYYNGYYYLTARSSYQPDVIAKYPDGKIESDSESHWNDIYYDGIEGYVSLNLYGYDNRKNKGVGYGLGNVLVLCQSGKRMNIGTISAVEDFGDLLE